MDYCGLGSGIIRALKVDADIEFQNEASGDQFREILWRTTRKGSEKTTQKIENKERTTQKTTQKTTQRTTQRTTQKAEGKEKITQKIIALMKDNPTISIEDITASCNLTRDGINWQIRKLKESSKIRRIGSDKDGHWELCD